jgi:uncharacterized protein YbjT (DUF2867 family)
MNLVITGANSAVGRAIIGWESQQPTADVVIAAVRSDKLAGELAPLLQRLNNHSRAARISYQDGSSLDAAFSGAAAVVHLAGILVPRKDSSYTQAHVESTQAVVEAAKRCRLAKIVLVSAIDADPNSRNAYYRTKGQAEELVRASGLPYTILRAPLLLGPGTEGSAALRRNAANDAVKLIGGGDHYQQPLHVGDLARAAVRAAALEVAGNQTLDMVGPESLTERELVLRAAKILGRVPRIVPVSKRFVSVVLGIRQLFGAVGFSRDALEVISSNTRMDSQHAARALGITLTPLHQMIVDSLDQESA